MFIKIRLLSSVSWGLLFMGLTLTVCPAVTANASSETSGTSGPLKLVIRMSKPAYLAGEMVVVHAILTNTSQVPVSVFKPLAPSSLLYSLDGVEIVRGRLLRGMSTRAPSSSDIVRLAPNGSISVSLNLSMQDIVFSIDEGRHTLVGQYITLDVSLEGIWKGEVKTSPLTFTVSPPAGAEAEAHQLYRKLLELHRSGFYPENFAQTKAVATDLMRRFPKSAYVSCALWKVVPQLFSVKRHEDAAVLTESYFALGRSDDTYIVKGMGRFCAEAYYHLGNHRKALAVLDRYAPGEDSLIRKRIEAALGDN